MSLSEFMYHSFGRPVPKLCLVVIAAGALVQCKTFDGNAEPTEPSQSKGDKTPDSKQVEAIAESLCHASAETLTTPVRACPETDETDAKKHCEELKEVQGSLGIGTEMDEPERSAMAALYAGVCKDLVRTSEDRVGAELLARPEGKDGLDRLGVRVFSRNLERLFNRILNESADGKFAGRIRNLLTNLSDGLGVGVSGSATAGPVTGVVGLRSVASRGANGRPSLGVYCVEGGGLTLPSVSAAAQAVVLRSFCGSKVREQGQVLTAAFQANLPLVAGSVDGGAQIALGVDPKAFFEGLNIDNFARWQGAILRDVGPFTKEMARIAKNVAEGSSGFERKAAYVGGQAINGIVAQLLERDEQGRLQKPASDEKSLEDAVSAFNEHLNLRHIADSLFEDRSENIELPVREGIDIVLAALRANRQNYPAVYALLERIRGTFTGCDFVAGTVSGSVGFGTEEDGSPFGASAGYSHYSRIGKIRMDDLESTFRTLGGAARTIASARKTAETAREVLKLRKAEVQRIRQELGGLRRDFGAAVNRDVTGNRIVDGAINALTWQFTFASRQFARTPDRIETAVDAAGRRLGDAIQLANNARETLKQANRTAFRAAQATADAMEILGRLSNPVHVTRQCIYKPAKYYKGIARKFFKLD